MKFGVFISVRYKCPRCNNEDVQMFYHGSKGWYCRKCVSFRRVFIEEALTTQLTELPYVDSEYQLGFSLTKEQVSVSKQIVKLLLRKKNILVSAICGAGKVSQLVMGV